MKNLRELGFDPVYEKSILGSEFYFAGPTERRTQEFESMLGREDVRALFCARGGYGSNYLLPRLDPATIAATPKIIVGCSDVTTLLTWLHDATGLITFHGPMVAGDWADERVDVLQFLNTVSGSAKQTLDAMEPLRKGRGQGKLYGGCLSMLVASLGTPYEIKTDGTILFIEDVSEPAYRLDRMLMHLAYAGKLNGVKGIIFGEMKGCTTPGGEDLREVLLHTLGGLNIPVAFGLQSGHVSGYALTLPIGAQAELTVGDSVSLTLDAAVAD